jgi:hypothetical protein
LGLAIAGGKMGWEMLGIRNGFERLLLPVRLPGGEMINLSPELIENDTACTDKAGRIDHIWPVISP